MSNDFIKMEVQDRTKEKIQDYKRSMNRAVICGLGDYAHALAKYIQAMYLSHSRNAESLSYVGLREITSETKDSVKAFYGNKRKRTNGEYYWIVRPGVGVRGSLNYLAKWADPSNSEFQHEFMQRGFEKYQSANGSPSKKIMDGWK